MLFRGDIEAFQATMRCVGCYLEHEGEILLLQKQGEHLYYPGKWGVVAGKVDPKEEPSVAIVREIQEEIGYEITPDVLGKPSEIPVIHPHFHFLYFLFHLSIIGERPQIRLSSEHCHFQWLAPELAVSLDLIEDEAEVIAMHYALETIKARS
ncbi:NUDIX domain-containing protein [Candidatus Falkowbacteria bacterium]|nr:NUDIX domain-containing protein [Candidatus Falkowbacteria bacterium]